MDVWEVPVSSCPGLDRGPLRDVGPEQVAQIALRRSVEGTEAPYSWGTGRSTDLLACTVTSVVGTGLAGDTSRKRPDLATFWKQVVVFRKSVPEAGDGT